MWSWGARRNLPEVNYNESSSGSSSPGSSRPASPPPGTPSEDSGLNQLRALTDQVASEQAINQLAERLDASFGNQEPEQIPGQRMANYDKQTGVDAASALEKACNGLKGYEFDEQDLGFYFNQVELQMRQNGVKKNYTKFLVLTSILPVTFYFRGLADLAIFLSLLSSHVVYML